MVGLGAVVAIAAVGGGTAYVAKDAEPGDMLYDMRAALYQDVSADADVEVHMKGALEDHEAARALQNSGQLTASERARLTASYSAHVNAVAGRIAELEATGDTDAAAELRIELRETLRMNRDMFPTIEVNVGGSMDADDDASSSMDSSDDDSSEDSDESESSDDDEEEDEDDATSSQGASSIFSQPSSSVTSA